MPIWMWIVKTIVGIVLGAAIAGAGLFGYIAWKAKARKWGGGMVAILIVCVILFYRFILNNPWNLLPF